MHGLSVLLTTLQASEHHASTFQLSLTIVLPRLRPILRPCSSQSVMGCLGKDSSAQPRDDQQSTLPLVFNNNNNNNSASRSAFAVGDLTSFVANTTSVQCTATDLGHTCRWLFFSQAHLAKSDGLTISGVDV